VAEILPFIYLIWFFLPFIFPSTSRARALALLAFSFSRFAVVCRAVELSRVEGRGLVEVESVTSTIHSITMDGFTERLHQQVEASLKQNAEGPPSLMMVHLELLQKKKDEEAESSARRAAEETAAMEEDEHQRSRSKRDKKKKVSSRCDMLVVSVYFLVALESMLSHLLDWVLISALCLVSLEE